MARITVEDCLEHVDNRFDLVLTAADRARKLMLGSVESTVDWEDDKATVVALREIASGVKFSESDSESDLELTENALNNPGDNV